MIKRRAGGRLKALARGFPVVVVTGPRQSGKTTLARWAFPKKPYASLEDPDEASFAREDPRGFLERFPNGAVLDEVQRCPDLFSYVQTIVDTDGRSGLFILTGSQQFGLLSRISQTLAGRAGLLRLLPLSIDELWGAGRLPRNLDDVLLKGFYPSVHVRRVSHADWYSSYMSTYVERDVRQVIQIRDLTAFQRFVRMCAARTGLLLNLSTLGAECGITHNTAKAWLSVLEASYVVFTMTPFHSNYGKRLVKTPKVYFLDTGFAAWLMGIRDTKQIAFHPLRGELFETLVVGELLKSSWNSGSDLSFHFWRDHVGQEVDIVFESNGLAHPIEVKSGKTLSEDSFTGLRRFAILAGSKAGDPALVFGGDSSQTRNGITVSSWRNVSRLISFPHTT